jgi:hypothetical protein
VEVPAEGFLTSGIEKLLAISSKRAAQGKEILTFASRLPRECLNPATNWLEKEH